MLSEKILNEVKKVYFALGQENIFQQQTDLINTVNKKVSRRVFSNFVPSYKNLASIAQIFDKKTPIKSKILLENDLVNKMSLSKGKRD